ncbi:MAG: Ig-like domain-containing protein [Clostridiales bacterium]|nr:Ig-like domain-containing protein [Clostridiales bacterium]
MKKLCCLLACLALMCLGAALADNWQFWEKADGTIVLSSRSVEGGEVITALSLGKGETRLIEVEGVYRPEFHTNRYYIARVDEGGVLTTEQTGDARISVYYDDKKHADLAVKVLKNPSKLEIDKTAMELQVGESYQLRYRMTKNTYSSLRWYSTDEQVALVDRHGKVTGVAPGECQVYLETENGLEVKCDVTVPLPAPAQVITEKYAEGYAFESTLLEYELRGGWQETVALASSDESILTVDESGRVACLKQGEAVVTLAASRGGQAQVYFTVLPAASQVIPEKGIYFLYTGGSVKLNVRTQGGSGAFTASCQDEETARVEGETLYALKQGISSVRFDAPGGAYAESLLIVRDKPENTALKLKSDEMAVGETQMLSLEGDAFPGAEISVYSTAPGVFSVDKRGRVAALSKGDGELVAEVGGLTFRYQIKVGKLAAGLEFGEKETVLGAGDSIILSARHIDGAGEITYSCPDAGVKIEGDCLTALSPGEYSVSARLISGSGAEMKLTVCPAASRLTPAFAEASIGEGDTLEIPVSFESGEYSVLSWLSADEKLAKVSEGHLTVLASEGSSYAEVSTAQGVKARIAINALPAPTEFDLGFVKVDQGGLFTDYVSLNAGESINVTPGFSQPYTHVTYTVSSFDPGVAKAEGGCIVGVKAGVARVKVETYNGVKREILVEVK